MGAIEATAVANLRASEFPLTSTACYLDHAASGPVPTRGAAIMRYHAWKRQFPNHDYENGDAHDLDLARSIVASFLGCRLSEIALVPSTCDGLAGIANSISWVSGDNVVIPSCDYPGVIYPFQRLASRGVAIKWAAAPIGFCRFEDLTSAVDDQTRAIALSHVQWDSGFRIDLTELGEFCRSRRILLITDAIQSVGAHAIDLQTCPVDVLVSGCFKWLLALPGVAILYVREEILESLAPDRVGRLSVAHCEVQDRIPWHADARRFMTGSVDELAVDVLRASIELLQGVGMVQCESQAARVVEWLHEQLALLGLRAAVPPSLVPRSNILSVTTGSADVDHRLCQHLARNNVSVSLRRRGVRVSPHAYNNLEDGVRLVDSVKTFLRMR